MRRQPTEKGHTEILGHEMDWEIIRSKTGSVFGIRQSRIYELNLYRDGTLVADYRKKWLRTPSEEDEAAILCINYLIEHYGSEKKAKEKKNHD